MKSTNCVQTDKEYPLLYRLSSEGNRIHPWVFVCQAVHIETPEYYYYHDISSVVQSGRGFLKSRLPSDNQITVIVVE